MDEEVGLRSPEWAVLAAGSLVYLLGFFMLTGDTTGQDAAGRGMAAGFGLLLQLPVWVLLTVFCVMLARRAVLPRLAAAAFVLVLTAALIANWRAAIHRDGT